MLSQISIDSIRPKPTWTGTHLDRNPVGQEPREEKRVVESASIDAGSLLFLATLDYPVKYCFNEHDTLRQRHHL